MRKRWDTETMDVWVLRYYHGDGATCWSKIQTIFNPKNLTEPGLVFFSNAVALLTWDCFTTDRPTFYSFKHRNASRFINDSSEIVDYRSVYFIQADYEPIPDNKSRTNLTALSRWYLPPNQGHDLGMRNDLFSVFLKPIF
ncbi:hypothetical protein V6N13_095168 [Hibiscus sabdariffa]